MKVVLDTMLWVSYCTRRDGSRHRLIDRALKAKVRLFVSDYILDELADVLREELNESARYVHWPGVRSCDGRSAWPCPRIFARTCRATRRTTPWCRRPFHRNRIIW